MTVATVSQKGWVVIPAELRRKYRLRPGARVVVVDYGGVLSLVPALSDPIAEAAGFLKGEDSLTTALLEERAREREREQ
jgi:AbrB family looped-hinge helix DNA binding protein